MEARAWEDARRRTIVCVDSYHKGILEGRFYNPGQEPERFESLSQFLNKMENLLDEQQMPQAYTQQRRFAELIEPLECGVPPGSACRGGRATFELQVIFRQHTSWQGVIVWLEKQWEQSFRSVLELVFLMDSALRKAEGSDGL